VAVSRGDFVDPAQADDRLDGVASTHHWEVIRADLAAPEVGTVWDLCIAIEYDREKLVEGVAEWLGSPDGLKVLDCACGSGFPALDLHQRGYDVRCTDASAPMLERFKHNARAAGVELEPVRARWQELDSLYDGDFDAVMCRGCSFLYAGTFDDDVDPDRSALDASLANFFRALRPGGRVYIDAPWEENLGEERPAWDVHPSRMIDGHRIELRERISADPGARIRRWEVELSIDDAPFSLVRRSHYMKHAELLELLRRAGFEDVKRVDVSGEHYAVFVGRKP
jgi:SAM-dependent methyltransferase